VCGNVFLAGKMIAVAPSAEISPHRHFLTLTYLSSMSDGTQSLLIIAVSSLYARLAV